MKSKLALLLAPLPFLLQGCFFFYIPGSVMSSISDSVTGSEGANCVGADAKVGDKIRLPDGSQNTIKSLSGTSSRCADARYPVRALLVPSTDEPRAAINSEVRLDLPIGWERKPKTDAMTNNGVITYALNQTIDSGVLLSSVKRDRITDLMSFAQSRRADQAGRLTEVTFGDITDEQLNGHRCIRFSVTGTVKGQRFTYSFAIIEGTSEIAVVNTWTTVGNYGLQAPILAALPERITGL
jgi:hypothetical protein